MTVEDDALPTSWATTKLGEVAEVNPSGTTVTAADEQPVTFLPMAAVEELSGHVDLSRQRPFGEVKKGFTRFRDGDLLFAKITPCMENGKTAVVRDLLGGIGCGSTEFHVLRPSSGVHPDYLRYFVVRSAFRQEARRNMQGAVGQQRVPVDFLREAELPLAPTSEQQRIVSKIDELFSRVEEGERALERTQKLVERYRQSVLKAAVTGALTREWREKNKGQLESGEALLTRILKARRKSWEKAELDKMKAKGVTPANDKWKQKYAEPSVPRLGMNEDLPPSWSQISLEQATLAERPIAYGVLQPGEDVADGVSMVRVCDVADGVVDTSNLKRISPAIAGEFPRTKLRGGEVLLTLVGTIGRTATVPAELAGANVARAVGMLAPLPLVRGDWLELCLRHEGTRQVLTENSREVARKTLNLEQLREYAIPCPSSAEQQEAVSRVNELLSKATAAAGAIAQQVRYAEALRQSALKAAFSGQLVTQDPTEEPAAALLQRVAAERDVPAARQKRSGKKNTHKSV